MNSLINRKFGRLTPIKRVDNDKWGNSRYLCKCDCGNEKIIIGRSLISGNTKSCGCLHKEGNNLKHGYNKTKIHRAWISMNQRCKNSKNKVCYRWSNKNQKGFKNFLEDIGEIPKGRSLSLINNKNNYSPSNYKIMTPKERARGRKDNIKLKFNGKMRLLIELAEEYKISPQALKTRLRFGWMLKEALTTPIRIRKSLLIRDYEHQLRAALWSLKVRNNNRISYSKDLPYSNKQLHDHLNNIIKNQNNCCPMCCKSYNINPFDIDHIIPTSKAKTREELLKLFNLDNLSPLCFKCNRWVKRDKEFLLKEN